MDEQRNSQWFYIASKRTRSLVWMDGEWNSFWVCSTLLAMTSIIEESRKDQRMHPNFNSTFISLMPKVDSPKSFEDFRHILQCNVIYKVITKIIANILKLILSKSISQEKFAFLEGRKIHEAIRVAQEGFHNINILSLKGTSIKINLSKAFDRVNQSYIHIFLTHVGFNLDFITWIMSCLQSVSFVGLINGYTSPFSMLRETLEWGVPL